MFEHFENEEPEVYELEYLNKLVDNYLDLQEKITRQEEELEKTKSEFTKYKQNYIPELLLKYQLSKITCKEKAITVKKDLSVSVPEEKRNAFFTYLKQNNDDSLIKNIFYIDKIDAEKITDLFNFLNKNGFKYTYDQNVHPQTLKKYFKTILEIDEEEPSVNQAEMLESLKSIANIFIYYTTTIK